MNHHSAWPLLFAWGGSAFAWFIGPLSPLQALLIFATLVLTVLKIYWGLKERKKR